jgi:Tol biopolymer transport system component
MKAIGYLRTTLVLGATMTAGLLTLTAVEPAGAAFPGGNGKIAFTSTRDGNVEIYTMNADGSSRARLTNATGNDASPAFSSDGSRIAFESSRPSSNPSDPSIDREIWVMNADGSGTPTNLSNASAGNDSSPSWSPDSSKVAFDNLSPSGPSSVGEIFAVDATGNNLTQVTDPESHPGNQHPGAQGRPSFSPDGKKIAYFDEPTKEVFG